jgi:hypothetical protein
MGVFKCQKCGAEVPDFDVAHVCSIGGFKAGEVAVIMAGEGVGKSVMSTTPENPKMWNLGVMIHGYRLKQTCSACPEQYDVFDDLGQQVAYFRLRHGGFRVDVPDCGGETIYTANPNGDGIFDREERVRYLTEAVLAVQEYYINRRWDKDDPWL